MDLGHIDLFPTFEDLRSWVLKLRKFLSCGFRVEQRRLEEDDTEESCDEGTLAPFDDETLGGHIYTILH